VASTSFPFPFLTALTGATGAAAATGAAVV